MDIKNQTQLQTELEKKATKALKAVTKEVLEIFKKDYIDKFAYIKSPKQYQRTYEFRESWDFTEIKKNLTTLSTELWYDSSKMKTFDPERFIHGSRYSSPNDVRETLPEILESKQSSLWISVSRTIKFWDWFVRAMIQGGQLEKIMTKHFTSQGFKRI